MTGLLVLIGLLGSIGAFGIAIRNLYKMVQKHKIHPTIDEQKFGAIRNTFVSMVIATALLYMTLVGAGGYVYLKGETVNSSLCALRGDLQHRIDQSQDYITKHPDKLKQLGFTVPQAEKEVANQERTVAALSELNCDNDG